jgi:RsmE family RNA methyltransferase
MSGAVFGINAWRLILRIKKMNKHEFALYYPIDRLGSSREYSLVDKDILHRITAILRLSPGDNLILFDHNFHANVTIEKITAKFITVSILKKEKNRNLKPAIHWFLPLLEREQLEESLYILSVLGAASIQPLITQKSRRNWSSKDHERGQRIMIAAAEQSKQFALPKLKKIDEISAVTPFPAQGTKIFFDPAGKPCLEILHELKKDNPQEIYCFVGPEGDLTDAEKELLKKHHFTFCALTPTVLKSVHAVAIGMGILRSII